MPVWQKIIARNLKTGEEKVAYQAESQTIQNGSLSPDGRYLALAVYNAGIAGRVVIVQTSSGEAYDRLKLSPG
jgi:hypothetical protein